jgi:hypothetical protein
MSFFPVIEFGLVFGTKLPKIGQSEKKNPKNYISFESSELLSTPVVVVNKK